MHVLKSKASPRRQEMGAGEWAECRSNIALVCPFVSANLIEVFATG